MGYGEKAKEIRNVIVENYQSELVKCDGNYILNFHKQVEDSASKVYVLWLNEIMQTIESNPQDVCRALELPYEFRKNILEVKKGIGGANLALTLMRKGVEISTEVFENLLTVSNKVFFELGKKIRQIAKNEHEKNKESYDPDTFKNILYIYLTAKALVSDVTNYGSLKMRNVKYEEATEFDVKVLNTLLEIVEESCNLTFIRDGEEYYVYTDEGREDIKKEIDCIKYDLNRILEIL